MTENDILNKFGKDFMEGIVDLTIEQIVNCIFEHIYNSNEFYYYIGSIGLRKEESIQNNSKKVIFYDSIDYENILLIRGHTMMQDIKKNGLITSTNGEIYVKSIYISFDFNEQTIKNIHIYFQNLFKYKFASDFIKRKFSEIEKINNEKIEKSNNKDNYPKITLMMGRDISLYIYYEFYKDLKK